MKSLHYKPALGYAIGSIAVYLITRYCLTNFYTPEWAARNLLWLPAIAVVLAALFGKVLFSAVVSGGYLVGLVLGELIGGLASDVPPSYSHYGWLILIVVLILSCVAGLLLEVRAMRRAKVHPDKTAP